MREVDMAAPFGRTWGTVFHQNKDAMLIATLSSHRFRVPGIQQQRVTIEDTDTGDSQPLPRNQLETLVKRTRGAAGGGFDLERLRRASTRCGGVGTLSRHVLDQEGGRIIEREETHESAVFVDTPHLSTPADDEQTVERVEPAYKPEMGPDPSTRIWREAQNGDNRR
jgi:hypothetical protein